MYVMGLTVGWTSGAGGFWGGGGGLGGGGKGIGKGREEISATMLALVVSRYCLCFLLGTLVAQMVLVGGRNLLF